MEIKFLFQILFFALMLLIALISLVIIYVLLRFGKSRTLGLTISAFYILIMISLYAAAFANFSLIPFAEI